MPCRVKVRFSDGIDLGVSNYNQRYLQVKKDMKARVVTVDKIEDETDDLW